MQIRLTKISPIQHRLDITRADGTQESAELETKSLLFHDLIHYALETEAQLQKSFWNLVAQGHSFLELNAKDDMAGATVPRDELGMTEMIVGGLTGYLQGNARPEEIIAAMQNACDAYGIQLPHYLTVELIKAVEERFRQLRGHWLGTPFGQNMELTWPAK